MAEFKAEILAEEDLTIISASGVLSTDEILACSRKLHEGGNPTRLFLWDARGATIDGISSGEFRKMETEMKDIVSNRTGGKTAIVSDTDLGYGIGRLYTTYTELDTNPVRYGIFRSLDDAMAWLKD